MFKNKSCLNVHIKTAKYCIKIQNELFNNSIETDKFTCNFCLKKFTTKTNLKTHEKVCV
jgi:hypothetical protein